MPAATYDTRQEAVTPQPTDDKKFFFVILWMVILIPLLAFPSNAAMQLWANRAIQIMAALLAGLLVLYGRLTFRRAAVVDFFGSGANLAVLLFLASSALSLWIGPPDPEVRRLGILKLQGLLAGALLYFATAYHARRREHLLWIADAMTWMAALMAVVGMGALAAQSSSGRVNLFGNSQLFGSFLLILLPIPLVLSITAREVRRKIGAQIALVLCVLGLLTTGVRSAWIGAGVMLLALILFSRIGASRRGQTTNFKSYLIPLLTVVACVLFAMFAGDAEKLIRERLQDGGSSLSIRQRMHWRAGQELLAFKPVFGLGPGAYAAYQWPYSQVGRPGVFVLGLRSTETSSEEVDESAPQPVTRVATPVKWTTARASLWEMAHSFWLQTAVEQGMVGAGLFAAILLTFLAAGLQRLRRLKSGVHRSLLLASMAGMVGFAIDGISNPGWEFPQIMLFFWLMLGLGAACLRAHAPYRE